MVTLIEELARSYGYIKYGPPIKGKVVLSCFDGISCGQVALDRLGIKVDKYMASEVDKYAIQVSQANYPDIEQVGDICNLDPKDYKDIDLILAGSPCQGFSFASNDKLNFNRPESKLFFEYIRLLDEIKPKYFLLENVIMEHKHMKVINDYMEILPIRLNSNRVSAQNRDRFYWTNIPGIRKPKDKQIMLDDILENDVKHPVYSNIYGGYGKPPMIHKYKAPTLKVGGEPPFATLKEVDSNASFNRKHLRLFTPTECEKLQTVPINYTEGVSNAQRYKMLGNGWTISIIAHILGNLKENPKPLGKIKQLKLI